MQNAGYVSWIGTQGHTVGKCIVMFSSTLKLIWLQLLIWPTWNSILHYSSVKSDHMSHSEVEQQSLTFAVSMLIPSCFFCICQNILQKNRTALYVCTECEMITSSLLAIRELAVWDTELLFLTSATESCHHRPSGLIFEIYFPNYVIIFLLSRDSPSLTSISPGKHGWLQAAQTSIFLKL